MLSLCFHNNWFYYNNLKNNDCFFQTEHEITYFLRVQRSFILCWHYFHSKKGHPLKSYLFFKKNPYFLAGGNKIPEASELRLITNAFSLIVSFRTFIPNELYKIHSEITTLFVDLTFISSWKGFCAIESCGLFAIAFTSETISQGLHLYFAKTYFHHWIYNNINCCNRRAAVRIVI